MNLSALQNLIKNIFLLEDSKNSSKTSFQPGEILKGKVLKQLEEIVLINIENRGIFRAYSKNKIKSQNILLKVIKNNPEPILKVLKELPDDEKLENVLKIIKNLKDIPKSNKIIKISEKILSDPQLLKKIIKQFPEKLGITYEFNISKGKINTENLKHKSLLKNDHHMVNFIEDWQKMANENFFMFPLFFKDSKFFDYAILGFKKYKKNEDSFFSIIIILKLQGDITLKTLILQKSNTLSFNFSTNDENFLKKIKNKISDLIKSVESNTNFKVINYTFTLEKNINNFESILEIIDIDKNDGIINLKA